MCALYEGGGCKMRCVLRTVWAQETREAKNGISRISGNTDVRLQKDLLGAQKATHPEWFKQEPCLNRG